MHLGGHDMVRSVDPHVEALVGCWKCSGCVRSRLGPMLMNRCRPEKNDTTEYGSKKEGKRIVTTKECQRLKEKFAKRGCWRTEERHSRKRETYSTRPGWSGQHLGGGQRYTPRVVGQESKQPWKGTRAGSDQKRNEKQPTVVRRITGTPRLLRRLRRRAEGMDVGTSGCSSSGTNREGSAQEDPLAECTKVFSMLQRDGDDDHDRELH